MYKYEVYAGYYKDELVYIGSGKKGRHLHLNSGVSHLYEANKLHFQNESIDVKLIYTTDNKKDSLYYEKLQIENLKPLWNKTYNNDNKICRTYDDIETYSIDNKWISELLKYIENLEWELSCEQSFVQAYREFIKRINIDLEKQNVFLQSIRDRSRQ